MASKIATSLVLEDRPIVRLLGYWSALASTIFSLGFVLASLIGPAIVAPLPEWDGIANFARNFKGIHALPSVAALLLIPTFVSLMTAVYYASLEQKRPLAFLSVVFAAIYAAIIGVNYAIQLMVLRPNLLVGETEGMALFAMTNPYSAFWALELIGYQFMSLSLIAAALALSGRGLEVWVRRLFLTNGIINTIATVAFIVFLNPLFVFIGLPIWSILFPISTGILVLVFRQ